MIALRTNAATEVMLDAVARLADVVLVLLPGRKVARCDLGSEPRPTVWLDRSKRAEDVNRALAEILLVIASGPEAAPTATVARSLHLVS